MVQRSVEEWLLWQESLSPRWIDLDLDRVRRVAGRLDIRRPSGPVFTVAGTNGKGSTVALLEAFLGAAGRSPGVFSSPHLLRYNERMRLSGQPIDDKSLTQAFEQVEEARDGIPLTFFEYGTLSALQAFSSATCDSWILEVGMGGRLDAVNSIDPDYALITTVALDHQAFLGDTIEQIAAEKAGILRTGRPAFFGDQPVPAAIRKAAARLKTPLRCLGRDFSFISGADAWSWQGESRCLEGLRLPQAATPAQLRNISLVLAAIEQYAPTLLDDPEAVNRVILDTRPAGRFQLIERKQQWILDVAHNPQALATLRAQLATLAPARHTTAVIGLMADKDLDAFPEQLGDVVDQWISCTVNDRRARSGADIAARLRSLGMAQVQAAERMEDALLLAEEVTPPAGRILVCGSFRVVGPALQWLGIY